VVSKSPWNRAGAEAGYLDNLYTEKGAKIVPRVLSFSRLQTSSHKCFVTGANDVTGKVDIPLLRKDQILVGSFAP